MSCNPLNSGYIIECPKDSIGGLKIVRFAMFSDVYSIIEEAGEITEIVLNSGGAWYGFELAKNTASFSIKPTPNVQNSSLFYNESLSIVMNKMKLSTSLILESLASNALVAIVEDNNGKGYLLGRTEGIDLSGGEIGSGTSFGDRNGYELSFEANEAKKVSHISDAMIALFYGIGTPPTHYILVNEGEFLLIDTDSKLKYL